VLVVAGAVDVVVTAAVGAGAIVAVAVVSGELETHPAATSIATTSVETSLRIAHLQEPPVDKLLSIQRRPAVEPQIGHFSLTQHGARDAIAVPYQARLSFGMRSPVSWSTQTRPKRWL